MPGYDSLRPGHVYARPSPRARAPPQHEALFLWKATYPTPSQMTSSLAALAQSTLDGESPLSRSSPLARELDLMSKRELKALSTPSPNLRYYLDNALLVQCPEQRTRPITGVQLFVGSVPTPSWADLLRNQSTADGTSLEWQLLSRVHADDASTQAWSVKTGWASPSSPIRLFSAYRLIANGATKATDADREYLGDMIAGVERTLAEPAFYNSMPDSSAATETEVIAAAMRVTRKYRSEGKISQRDWQTCLGLRRGCWPPRPPPSAKR
jgi:hypothetical protein